MNVQLVKFLFDTEFVNNRHKVKLVFKENILLVSDNYEISQKHLNKFKNKLSQKL